VIADEIKRFNILIKDIYIEGCKKGVDEQELRKWINRLGDSVAIFPESSWKSMNDFMEEELKKERGVAGGGVGVKEV